MIRHGEPPYLECSSRGDKRFSAFYARIKHRSNQSIEEIFQGAKVFTSMNGIKYSGLSIKEAKGRRPDNLDEVKTLYSKLWDAYMIENPQLLDIIRSATGLSDVFGQPGHCCQATELWRIRNEHGGFNPL
jgi:hypothetical protein